MERLDRSFDRFAVVSLIIGEEKSLLVDITMVYESARADVFHVNEMEMVWSVAPSAGLVKTGTSGIWGSTVIDIVSVVDPEAFVAVIM